MKYSWERERKDAGTDKLGKLYVIQAGSIGISSLITLK